MGLASSQARLLLLTARKSDLEYRMQMISQRKIMLAMATEELATDYTKAISKRMLKFVYANDENKQLSLDEKLTYYGLVSENSEIIGKYIVTDLNGDMAVPLSSKNQVVIPSGFAVKEMANGELYAVYIGKDEEGKLEQANNALGAMSDSDFYAQFTPPGYKDEAQRTVFKINVVSDLNNVDLFQNGLRNGGLFISKLDSDSESFVDFSWQSSTVVKDVLDTNDINIAQAEYEAKSAQLKNQDKVMDLEMKQIETQHKAIETEYDSVKQVIQKNIETSFKVFANG